MAIPYDSAALNVDWVPVSCTVYEIDRQQELKTRFCSLGSLHAEYKIMSLVLFYGDDHARFFCHEFLTLLRNERSSQT